MSAPLRLGVFADDPCQQAWVVRALEEIAADRHIEVAVLALPAGPAPAGTPEATGRDSGRLFRLYSRLDRHWSGLRPDPFAPRDLAAALPGVPHLHLDAWSPDAAARVQGLRLDVALDLGLPGLRRCGSAVARLGILSPARGHRLDGAAGAAEVLADEPALCSEVVLDTGAGPARGVARSWSRTDRLSLHCTAGRHAWKSSHLLPRALRALAAEAPAAPESHRGGDAAAPLTAPPSAGQVLGFLPRQAGRLLAQARRKHLTRRAWFLAYQLDPAGPVPERLTGFRPLRPPRDRFWADPFPVVTGDTCHIFVEEWPYRLGRGRIAVLELDRTGRWRRLGTALERDHHLSYPFVFRWRGEAYMVPESSEGGAVELYRAATYPLVWEPVAVLLQDARAVDATLVEREGCWWMFVNRGDEGVSRHDELHLYRADSPLGPWQPHPDNPVVSDVRAARPAGRLISWGGELYRPAQDCSRRYGYAVEVRRVVKLSMEAYREEPYRRLDPADLAGANRTHTLNSDGWITVVDGHRDRWGLP